MTDTNINLIQGLREQSPKAQRKALERFGNDVFAQVARMLPAAEDAEEVYQDVFVKVFSTTKPYDEEKSSLKTWISRIAYNEAVTWLRHKRQAVIYFEDREGKAEQQGLAFQKHLKKKNIKQMRKMDAMALCDGDVGFAGFWPCVDGYVICDDQYRLYERGEYNDVPVIVMTNSDEGALFSAPDIKAEDYQKLARQVFGDFADEALKVYPGRTDDEAWHGNGDAFRDMGFAWPSYAWVSLQSKTGKSSAYAAFLAQPSTRSLSQDPRRKGVAHADDILYMNGEFLSQPDKYPHEAAVAEILQQYWVNFAKTCNPNGKGLPYWPTFDEKKPTTMQFSNGASLIMVPNRDKLDFVDRFYKAKREETEKQRECKQ